MEVDAQMADCYSTRGGGLAQQQADQAQAHQDAAQHLRGAAPCSSQFDRAVSLQHMCNHRCNVEQLFGNTFRCTASRLLHVCDSNCDKRIEWDRYSSICVISKRLFSPLQQQLQPSPPEHRKRGACCSSQDLLHDGKKACVAVAHPGVSPFGDAFGSQQECFMEA